MAIWQRYFLQILHHVSLCDFVGRSQHARQAQAHTEEGNQVCLTAPAGYSVFLELQSYNSHFEVPVNKAC